MDTISPVKGRTIPKEVKIVNKKHLVCCTGRLEPCVKAKDPAETADALAQWGQRSGNENTLSTVFQRSKEPAKILF